MLDILFWIFVGLIIGWNLLPQPEWVENVYNMIANYIKNTLNKNDTDT